MMKMPKGMKPMMSKREMEKMMGGGMSKKKRGKKKRGY